MMFSTYDQMKYSSGFRSEEEGAVREGCKIVALLLKPSRGLFGLIGPVPSPAATPRVCHRTPDCTRVSTQSSENPGTLWC